ncbi:helix-turn-helix domain-containing protein [Flavobacterium hiemivividum]|uniref:AraC family transcriptional regulator n=1 Tax=Flavobacterium hiemivividum TaxID=2541734 RepID=A0A4R5CSU3_9FLAO|nr:helix-turn-helix domain-containing protein [Flavobacterium hiemivividum]TDE01961.1 AraC family transcriptional regulator [Flavobacterium hiemivividum]
MPRLFWNKNLLFFLLPIVLFAQVHKKDLSKLPYDDLKKLFFDNVKNQTNQKEYAHLYLAKAKYENNSVEKAKGYYLYSLLSDGTKAIRYLDSAIACSKTSNDIKFPAYAYSQKGYVLKNQFKYREAIDNFIIAEKYARKNNPDFYYKVKFSIAALRSEELGEVPEALDLYRECFNYYKDKEVRTPRYSYAYQNVLFALADAHKALQQSDSASYYNKLGFIETKFNNDDEYNALFILNEGANLVLKKNFSAALDSINKALPKMIAYKDVGNTLAAYYYFGKAYEGLGRKDLAVKNFLKVDSIYKIAKRITPEFMSGYPYLISYYKNSGDKEKQLQYLSQYMLIESTLQNNYKELTKKLQKEYDSPYLFSEKEALIQDVKKEKTGFYWVMGILALLVISTGLFGWYQYNHKKKYRLRFDTIMNKSKLVNDNKLADTETKENRSNATKTKDIGIAEELVNQILMKLNQFEDQKGYLECNLTVQILSVAFDTNSKYVSKIINMYKEKSFIQYINDLRIDYAIVQLQQQKQLRNFKMQALAEEFGFNGAESFSAAFYKKTGIKPTYFIKELTELNKI